MTDDTAWPLAQHVCRTRYADLPASTIQSTRRDIVDTLGCMRVRFLTECGQVRRG